MTERAPPFLGRAGVITLLAALLVAALTLGIAPLRAMRAVRRVARSAPIVPVLPPRRILVLGHALVRGGPSAEFAARLSRALQLAREFPKAQLLILGGATGGNTRSEAEVGRAWLVAHGLEQARIATETQSRHTLENLRNLRMTQPAAGPEAIVTSRVHLCRVLLMARGFGLVLAPVAAEDEVTEDLPRICAEGFLVHWYLTGRALARLLRRRSWLERIT